MKDFMRVALVGLLGAASVLAWAPYAWWPVLLPVYGVLGRVLAQAARPLAVARLGLVFGLAQHLAGHGWILGGLSAGAGFSPVQAGVCTLAFALYLSFFVAMPCYLWARIHNEVPGRRPAAPATALSLAAFLTLGDWGRSQFFNGFSSLSPGYAWIDTPLVGYLPLLGIYGLGFMVYAFSFLPLSVPTLARQGRYRRVVLLIAGIVSVTGIGCWCESIPWVRADGAGLSYRLIQANVHQERKYDPRFVSQESQRMADLVTDGAADLVATPETAFPQMLHQLPSRVFEQLRNFSAGSGSHLFLGIITIGADGGGRNSVAHLAPGAVQFSVFNKIRLMPFGEYSPWGFAWLTRQMHIPFKDLLPGTAGQSGFAVKGTGIGILVCQEDQSSDLSRQRAHDAGIVISPSNLAWFEHSLAIPQDLQIVRARAMEIGRPILRVANTGVTAHIDHRGRVVRRLPTDQADVLQGIVEPAHGLTPFTVYGNSVAVAGCLFIILGIVGARCLCAKKGGKAL